MGQSDVNLDATCARYGWNIASGTKDDTLINKALGVLQEQGVYALFLFLKSRGSNEKDKADQIRDKCWKLLTKTIKSLENKEWKSNDWPQVLRENLLSDIDSLFFAYQLLEQTLIYARYHAKSLKED